MTQTVAQQVRQITPFMHVAALEPALKFLTEIIGFKIAFQQPGYAYLELGAAALRVLEAEEAKTERFSRSFRYYVDVVDVDAVYAALKLKLDALPAGDVVGPKDQPYRQRELIILAPDGGCLVFGSPIRP